MRRRRKKPIWAWVGGHTSLTWISGELVAGVTKNVILVDEPVLSSHGLDANTRVERVLIWNQLIGLNGPYIQAPNWDAVLWNGVEDTTDTPTGVPELASTSNGDFWADKRIMHFDSEVMVADDTQAVDRLRDRFTRRYTYDIKVRRKVPTKGHVSYAQRFSTGVNEEGSINSIVNWRCLVVADYR